MCKLSRSGHLEVFFRSFRLFRQIACVLSALAIGSETFAADTTHGAVEGRVTNATNGAPLRSARVLVTGTRLETITADDGSYRINEVPPGEVHLAVRYLGFTDLEAILTVTAGATAQKNFDAAPENSTNAASTANSGVVNLTEFNVVAGQMSAQAIAQNERRAAPNIKNVVAYEEFGDRGDENIGEFLRYLPGVSIEDGGQVASTITLRGFPAQYSTIMLDGAEIASARGNSRAQSLLDVSMGNMSRVEISKVPTPDMPASGLGGSINLITKSGLGTKRPVFNYQAYLITDGNTGLTLDGGPRGLTDRLSPKHQQPSFSFNGLVPITKNFVLNFSGSKTWRLKPMERDGSLDTQADYNLLTSVQRVSTWLSLDNILETWSAQIGGGWRISKKDTLTFGVSHRYVSNNILRLNFTPSYGTGATGDNTFTQGTAAANGSITQNAGANQETGTDTTHGTMTFSHRSDNWTLNFFAAMSHSLSFLNDIDNGHFNAGTATLSGLILRGEGTGEDDARIPVRYSATNAAGTPVNIFDGGNYLFGNATSTQNKIDAKKASSHVDFTRPFDGPVPFTLKTGISAEQLRRDAHSYLQTWAFTPPTGTTKAAGNFDVFDDAFNATAPTIFHQQMRWISPTKYYDLKRSHPDWFVRNDPLYVQNFATNSRRLTETIESAYLRGDVRLFNNRLWIVAGARYEHTKEDGFGLLDDPSAQYQKDAQGNLVDGNATTAGIQPIFLTNDLTERARERYKERGTHTVSTYGNLYPSLNTTFNITDKLLFRAAYSRTLGRPDYGSIIPGSTIQDPSVSVTGNPTITVNNTGLKPWTADSYDFSLESYQIKGGFGSVGVFQKNIQNFFGSLTQAATPELLAKYGLPNDPIYQGYDIVTQTNAGDARVRGVEFTYTQSLLFLPDWARGFQVFANGTKLQLRGSNVADFTGFAPSKYAGGVNFVRKDYYIKLNFTYQGETRGAAVAVSTANGIPDGTYDYQGERFRMGIGAGYALTKSFVLFGSMTDINGPGGFIVNAERFAPGTAKNLRVRRRQELGSTINIGIKGTF